MLDTETLFHLKLFDILFHLKMIPKIIHYCWFGRGEMPPLAKKCIKSWKKYCPDYEIKEWNEDNFDLDMYPYAREAYDNRKFAFVTDVVRLYAIYTEGGIYMDTDVEVLKPLDSFLKHIAFSGYENDTLVPTGIMASEKGAKWIILIIIMEDISSKRMEVSILPQTLQQ